MYTNKIKCNYYINKCRNFSNDVTVAASSILSDACANKNKIEKKKVNVIGDVVKKNNIIKNNNNFEKPVYTAHTTDYTHPLVSVSLFVRLYVSLYTSLILNISLSLSGNDSSRRAGNDASRVYDENNIKRRRPMHRKRRTRVWRYNILLYIYTTN